MRKARATFCEICEQVPPCELACVDKPDPENFRWMCVSCHHKFDYTNGTRNITTETKQKIGLANSGKNNGFFGKKHTETTKQKMRGPRPLFSGKNSPMFGETLPEETRHKLSLSHIGKTHSENTILKMSESHQSDKNPFFGKLHTISTKLRIKLALESRRYALLRNMTGRFHIPEQWWVERG